MSQEMYTVNPLIGGSLVAMGGTILLTHPESGATTRVVGAVLYGVFLFASVVGAAWTLSSSDGGAPVFLALAAVPTAYGMVRLAGGPHPQVAYLSGAAAGFFLLAALVDILLRLVAGGRRKR